MMLSAGSDGCSYLRGILKSNLFHTSFSLISGLCCFLPVVMGIESNLEHSSLRESLSSSPEFFYSCVASLAITIPLFCDLFFDYLAKVATTSAILNKPAADSGFNFLNISERLLFLVGIITLPLVIFLPSDSEKLALLYLCCNKCQLNLVGGAVLISLCRYDNEYWSVRSTLLSLFCFAFGLITSTFLDNIYAGETSPSSFLANFDTTAFAVFIFPCVIFLFNSSRWLIIVYYKVYSWKGLLMCSKVQPLIELKTVSNSKTTDHTFFPMVYTVSSICVILMLFLIIASSSRIEKYKGHNLLESNLPFLVFAILISTLSMRIVKFEVVQGLVSWLSKCNMFVVSSNLNILSLPSQYALIESKKSYVRYISHELRTPLNSAFLGTFTGNIT